MFLSNMSDCTCPSHRRSKGNWCYRSRGPFCKWIFVWSDKGIVARRMLQSRRLQWRCCYSLSWGRDDHRELAVDEQADADKGSSLSWHKQMNQWQWHNLLFPFFSPFLLFFFFFFFFGSFIWYSSFTINGQLFHFGAALIDAWKTRYYIGDLGLENIWTRGRLKLSW